jgi:hypothetical protein
MMDHHPLQQDLAIAIASVDAASKRLAALKVRQREAHERAHELGNSVGPARDLVRTTAGAVAADEGTEKDAQAARKALRELESEAEVAELELSGIVERVNAAEADHAEKCRAKAHIEIALCQLICRIVEGQLSEAGRGVIALEAQRHRLAKRAAQAASDAGLARMNPEPIPFADLSSGLWRRDAALASALQAAQLRESFNPQPGLPPAEVSDLLEFELPPVAVAAE